MALVLSSEMARNSCLRVTWQWTDGQGVVHGPFVAHAALGTDPQVFANAMEQVDLAALASAEIASNLEEIAS